MNLKFRAEMLGRTEEEIRSEMANALGRIGRKFQYLVAQVKQLEPAMEIGPAEALERYWEVLQEARLYYWYLIVQRESVGLRNHEDVHREYGVPVAVLRRK
jgi:hypothetical protein